jgi:hypothetical protein
MRYLPLGNADFTSNKFMVDAFGISGCHRMHGVFIASGGPIKTGLDAGAARIYDVSPTLLYLLGQSVPDDMDGRVLTEIISERYLADTPLRRSAGSGASSQVEVEYSQDENSEIIESLKNLGYMG